MRVTPEGYHAGPLDYVTTIVADGGRLSDLEQEVETWEGEPLRISSGSHHYLIEKNPLEVDIYIHCKTCKTHTRNDSFRKSLGFLLVLLMQCGYSIKHENKEDLLQPRKEEVKGTLDF